MSKKILVTGGLGYIGSHTVVELIQEGCEVIIVDDLSNASLSVLEDITAITAACPIFYKTNVCDKKALMDIFKQHQGIAAVIHFAAYKAVAESVKDPLKYYRNNLDALITVLECMQNLMIPNFIFSSSATVYGHPETLPVSEETIFKKSLSAYGSTKQMGEDICEKVCSIGALNAVMLRYFNPVGAHASGLIGESPSATPNNLMPYVTQVARGKLEQLTVYGNDYPTSDGTCIRDYVHVVDLAKAHVASCNRLLEKKQAAKFEVFNIGTGNPISVLELINTFENTNKLKVPYTVGDRRAGDTPTLYADVAKATTILGWTTCLTLEDMVGSAWNFEKKKAV